MDVLRVTVVINRLNLTGWQIAAMLRDDHGVIPELASLKVVVFALGPGTTLQHAQGLVQAFESICNTSGQRQQPPEHVRSAHLLRLGARCMQQESHIAATPRHAMFTPTERVSIEEAGGRASAELLCPYPPGVPAAFPGECISQDIIKLLQGVQALGGVVIGASDASLCTVEVLQ